MNIADRTLNIRVNLIAAMGENRVIGVDGGLPWRLPDEMKHFVRVTSGHTVVMGRRTFESIGCKPLPNRLNIVLTRDADYAVPAGVKTAASVAEAVKLAVEIVPDTFPGENTSGGGGEVFICGGEAAYREALPLADTLYLTVVHANPEGDARFPEFDLARWKLTDEVRHEADARHAQAFTFRRYERVG